MNNPLSVTSFFHSFAAVVFINLLCYSNPGVAAVSLFNNETTQLEISAQIQARVEQNKSEQFIVDDAWLMSSGESWVNASFSHQASPDITAFGVIEWQFDPFRSGNPLNNDQGSFLVNRLGLLGIKGERFGQLSFGKQWSASSDLLSVTDNMFVAKPDASGMYQLGDGGINGNGRLDNGIVYRNGVGGMQFGVQYGAKKEMDSALIRQSNRGAMIRYLFDMGLLFGVSYSESQLRNQPDSELSYYGISMPTSISTTAFSVQYQSQHAYIGLNVIDGNKAHSTAFAGQHSLSDNPLLADATGADIYLHYQFENRMKPYLYYSLLKFDDQEVAEQTISGNRAMIAIGLLFVISDQLSFGGEYHHHQLEDINAHSQGSARTLALQLEYQL